jgi:hypothetical protein
MSLQPLPSLLATTVLLGRDQVNASAFANTTADLATGNATAGAVIGVNQSAITVNSPGSVIGGVVAGLSGTAISVGNNADTDAGALTSTALVGFDGNSNSTIIGGTGSIQGSLLATLTAAGTSTDGSSDATAGALEAIGVRAGSLAINGDGTIAGISQLTQSATARTTAGSSNADSQVNTVNGLVAGSTSSITVDGTGALYGAASLVSSATAVTVGDDATTDTANATQAISTGAIGIDLSGATASSIGGAAALTGQAEVVGSANASGTSANANAVAGATEIVGLRPSNTATIQSNGAGVISASGSGVFTAQANTTSGGAQANTDGTIYGVNGDLGSLAIGGNGVLNASALFDGTAIAATIDGLGSNANALVTPAGGRSIAFSLNNSSNGLLISGNASLATTAKSNQSATASVTHGANAIASVAASGDSLIKGISGGLGGGTDQAIINIDGVVRDFASSSTLIANAAASSGSGTATANDSEYRAIGTDNARISIAGDSSGELRSTSKAKETLTANSLSGNATSAALGSFVQGITNSDLSIAGSGSIAVVKAELDLTQFAKTTSGSSASVDIPSQAFNVNGLRNGNVSFGSNGSVEASAQTNLKLQALNTTGNADSFMVSGTAGSDLRSPDNHITINGSGNIISAATVNGLVESSTVAGPSRSGGTQADIIASLGIFAEAQDISFSVAGSGNITGSSEIGTSTAPFQVKASSVHGSSQATLNGDNVNGPRSIGVEGADVPISDATRLQTSAGVLTGVSTIYFQFSSESINGNSSSGFAESASDKDSLSSYGARNANLIIDRASGGSSDANGSASSFLTSSSKTVSGESVSRLAFESKGIFSTTGIHSIQAANTFGQSQISASSLASTVMGNSIASTLRNLAADEGLGGIVNYSINSLGTGSILANSSALLKSQASSVSGTSTGFSTI